MLCFFRGPLKNILKNLDLPVAQTPLAFELILEADDQVVLGVHQAIILHESKYMLQPFLHFLKLLLNVYVIGFAPSFS
jgi:hypothetical protein